MSDPPEKPADQVWELVIDGRAHLVEARGSVSHRVRWYVDGELVAEKKATEDKLRLSSGDGSGIGDRGGLEVRFSGLGHGVRATVDGIDLDPEPGSKAAAYEEKVRAHPRRYAAIQTLGGVAKVVLPILVALLIARLAVRVRLPDWDLPDIPWPDVPWPDLPSIPWPDLPDITVPDWLVWVLDKTEYVVPVVIAVVLARAEIRRRRRQDRLREELRARPGDSARAISARAADRHGAPDRDDSGDQQSPGPP